MEMIILLFHIVNDHLSNFIILYDMECHLNSIFPLSNILINFDWSRKKSVQPRNIRLNKNLKFKD